jgi:hypothetical protein
MSAVVGTIFNGRMKVAGRHFFVPSFDHLVPVTDPPDSGNVPLTTAMELLTGNAGQETLVRLEGLVTLENESGFYLRDGAGSAFVRTPLMERFRRGASSRQRVSATWLHTGRNCAPPKSSTWDPPLRPRRSRLIRHPAISPKWAIVLFGFL